MGHEPEPIQGIASILAGIIAFAGAHSPVAAVPLTLEDARSVLLAEGASRLGRSASGVEIFGPTPEVLPDGSGDYVLATVGALGESDSIDLWFDLSTGNVLSAEEWDALAQPIAKAMGPITPELGALLKDASESGRLTVAVAVNGGKSADALQPVIDEFGTAVDRGAALEIDDPDITDELANAIVSAWSQSALSATQTHVYAAQALGLEVEYIGKLAPVFWATGTPDQIRSIAETDGTIAVYPSYKTDLTMDVAGPTDQADYSYASGHRGAGARIAVVEYGNINYLVNSHFNGACIENDWINARVYDDHPEWVAGAIIGQSSSQRGVAPSACLVSVGTGGEQGGATDDWRILAAVDVAILEHDAHILNLSIIQNTPSGQSALRDYLDHVVRAYGVHIAASGGNSPQCLSGQAVISPGTAWNVVTVGTLNDDNSPGWSDDVVNTGCWADPPNGPFKPEISAPGTNVEAAGIPGDGGGFASISVPQVAGTFAQLIGINQSELAGSPIRTKAIVLAASHVHMVEADTAEHRLHIREGIGSLTSKWSDRIAKRAVSGGYPLGNFGRDQFNATYEGPCFEIAGAKTFTISTKPGNYVRVVIDWFSHAFYDRGTDGYGSSDVHGNSLPTDLDLYVTGAGETYTSRWHNGYNVAWVQFPAETDTYTGRVEVYGDWPCTIASEAFGWAYVSWSTP